MLCLPSLPLKASAPVIHPPFFLNVEHLSEPGTAIYFYNPEKNDASTRPLFKAAFGTNCSHFHFKNIL